LEPLLGFSKPLEHELGPAAYVDLQRADDTEVPPGRRYYTRSGYLQRIEPDLIDRALALIEGLREQSVTVFFTDTGGGAVSRVRPADTALCAVRQDTA